MIRQAFETGKPISRFIARDVRREILVVNIDELSSGFIIARTRTSNLFYLSKKLTEMREFGKPERISIEDIWNWTGQSWGGLPDGTSIVENRERVEERAIQ
ncbi:MAG: hypothetical protein AAF456_14630 [Planctomycetota bacterium]